VHAAPGLRRWIQERGNPREIGVRIAADYPRQPGGVARIRSEYDRARSRASELGEKTGLRDEGDVGFTR